jgi:hypothetical protein
MGEEVTAVTTPPAADRLDTTDPPVLLAIVIAARRTGNRLLERVARRELEERHQIRVQFAGQRSSTVVAQKGVSHG